MALTINNFWGAETGGLEEVYAVTSDAGISAVLSHSGGYCYRARNTAVQDIIHLDAFESVADAGAGIVAGVWYRKPLGEQESLIFAFGSAVGTYAFSVRMNNDATLELMDSSGSSIISGSTVLDDSTYHFIEVYAERVASGDAELFVDGVSQGNVTTESTVSSGSRYVYLLGFGTQSSYFDDIYLLSGASSSADRLGGAEVFSCIGYLTSSNPDWNHPNGTLNVGTWRDPQEVPFNDTNYAAFTDSTARGGGIDTNGFGYTEGGPNGNTNIDGDSNIVAMKGIWRMKRSGGSGAVHYGLMGNTGTAIADSDRTADFDPTTDYVNYFDVREDNLPLSTEYGRIGFEKDNKGQDFNCAEMLFQILHVPSGQTDRIVTGITDDITITDNDATVTRTVNRTVTGITDDITVTDNNAVVNKARTVIGITDDITITDNDATVNRARNVIGITDDITITDNDAVVTRTAPRNVVGITDIITITDNDAVVNKARTVVGTTETIDLKWHTGYWDVDGSVGWLNPENLVDGDTITFASAVSLPTLGSLSSNTLGQYIPSSVRWRLWGTFTGDVTCKVDIDHRNPAPEYLDTYTFAAIDTNLDAAFPSPWRLCAAPAAGWNYPDLETLNARLTANTTGIGTTQIAKVDIQAVYLAKVNKARTVVGITDTITITDNDAVVIRTEPRNVVGITDTITIIDNDAVVNKARTVVGVKDDITITDNDATVNRARNVTGITDTITITDNDATVTRNIDRIVTGITDNITITDNNATVNRARNIAGITDDITITDNDATINRTRNATGITDTIDITDNDATVTRGVNRDVVGITDTITITDNDATITRNRVVTGITDDITITDNDAVVNRARTVTGITDDITITDNNATINRTRNVAGITDTITITDNDAIVTRGVDRDVIGITDTITITDNDATVTRTLNRNVTGITDTITIIDNDAVVNKPRNVIGITEDITVITNDAIVNTDRVVVGITEDIVITDNDATVTRNIDRVVIGITEDIVITDNDATVTRTTNRVVTGITEVITITDNDATITRSGTRNVLGITEVINVAENLATVKSNRHVQSITDFITVGANDANITRADVATRRIFIVG